MDKIVLSKIEDVAEDYFSCKIKSTYLTYKDIPNSALFWKSQTATYCLWGDNMTIKGRADREFVSFISPKTVLCDSDNAVLLNLKTKRFGEIMHKHIYGLKNEIVSKSFENSKLIYDLVSKCFPETEYEAFLLDISRKLRLANSEISSILTDEKAISVALSSYICDNTAIITFIATRDEYRKMSYARDVLVSLEEKLCGRDLFLLKEKNKNDIFYQKMGYQQCGNWVLGELK